MCVCRGRVVSPFHTERAPASATHWHAGGGEVLQGEELRNLNPLMALLRTMLPWVAAGEAPPYGEDGEGGGEGAPPGPN